MPKVSKYSLTGAFKLKLGTRVAPMIFFYPEAPPRGKNKKGKK